MENHKLTRKEELNKSHKTFEVIGMAIAVVVLLFAMGIYNEGDWLAAVAFFLIVGSIVTWPFNRKLKKLDCELNQIRAIEEALEANNVAQSSMGVHSKGVDGAQAESSGVAGNKMYCKRCGALLNGDAKFCDKCGTPIGGEQEEV